MSLLILQVIPSLVGYIIIVLNFNCATCSLFPEHNFRRWGNLTPIFLIVSFRLEHQAWFRVCVILLVPIIFRLIIPLTWCRRRSITSSWNLATNVSWSSSAFWALPRYQSNSWREIPSLPLDDLCNHRQHSYLPPTQTGSYNFGNTSFLSCRWIVAEPVGHTLIVSLLKL